MGISDFFGVVLTQAFIFGVLGLIGKNWLLERLKNSIKHEYDVSLEKFKGEIKAESDKDLEELKALLKQVSDQNLEEYKYEIEKRKRAEMVAKLLAHWLSFPEQQEELNRLTFECFLWLPDDIAQDLSSLLARKEENKVCVRSVLNKIRKHLNSESPSTSFNKLENYQIIVFPQEAERKYLERVMNSIKSNE